MPVDDCLDKYTNECWIYFISGVDGGPVKIGMTEGKLKYRLKALQCGSPVKLGLIAKFKSRPRIEKLLHEYFAESRLHGEWFEMTDKLKLIMMLAKAGRGDIIYSLMIDGGLLECGCDQTDPSTWIFENEYEIVCPE